MFRTSMPLKLPFLMHDRVRLTPKQEPMPKNAPGCFGCCPWELIAATLYILIWHFRKRHHREYVCYLRCFRNPVLIFKERIYAWTRSRRIRYDQAQTCSQFEQMLPLQQCTTSIIKQVECSLCIYKRSSPFSSFNTRQSSIPHGISSCFDRSRKSI